MKYKKVLSAVLASVMVVSSLSFNAIADTADLFVTGGDDSSVDETVSGGAVETADEIISDNETENGIISDAIESIKNFFVADAKATAEAVKVAVAVNISYGKGTAEITSGLYKDDISFVDGYLKEGETAEITVKPEEGWQLDKISYFNASFGLNNIELTAAEGKENTYKFTVPNDYYSAVGLYMVVQFKPILAEGEYEIYLNNDGSSAASYDVDRLGAKEGEIVTITTHYSKATTYTVPTVKDEAENEIEVTRQSIKLDAAATEAVYTFVMPASKVTVYKKTSSNCNYTLKTIPEEFAPYVSFKNNNNTVSMGQNVNLNVTNEINGKYYRADVNVRATLGTENEAVGEVSSVSDGVSTYIWKLSAVEAEAVVTFTETTPYTITNNVDIAGAAMKLSNSTKAAEGDKVTMTLTVETQNGYYYDTAILPEVKGSKGGNIDISVENSTAKTITFSFIMPADNVSVNLDSQAVKQKDLRTVTVAEDSKSYITADAAEAREGNAVNLTVDNTSGAVQFIKVQYEGRIAEYFAPTTKKFTMKDANAEISVLTVTDSWFDEGNYDADLYNSGSNNWNISDAADFAAFGKKVKENSTFFTGGTINITKDIDMSGHIWIPVNIKMSNKNDAVTINGNGKSVTGLNITGYNDRYYGLFGTAYGNIFINNLSVGGDLTAHMKNTTCVGTLVAYPSGGTLSVDNCNTKFNVNIDGYTNNTLSIGDLVGEYRSDTTIINSSAENNTVIENCGSSNINYSGLSGILSSIGISTYARVKNNINNSVFKVGDNVEDIDASGKFVLCGIASNLNTAIVANNYFGGSISSSVDAEIYGIAKTITGDLTDVNYSYFEPVVPVENENEDYFSTVDSNNKVGRIKLATLLNEWVNDNSSEISYSAWTSDMESGKPVHKAAEQSAESFNIITDVTGTEFGELNVDEKAAAGKKVVVYVTPKNLCVLDSFKVVLAGDETQSVSTRKNDDGSYSFYMPGEDVKVVAVFAEDANTITVNKTGEGDVTVKPSVSSTTDKATAGETITVTLTPDNSKYFTYGTFDVKDAEGNDVEVTEEETGKYTFVMPKGNVTINVDFKDVNSQFNVDGTLKDGKYKLPVAFMKSNDHNTPSMASSCVVSGTVEVKDGISYVTIDLQPVTTMGLTAAAKNWKIGQTNSVSGEKTAADYHLNDKGEVDQITFVLPKDENGGAYSWGGVYANIDVDVLGGMNVDGWIDMDFVNAEPMESAAKFGSAQIELAPGEYNLPVKMMKSTDITSASMAGSCIKDGKLIVNDDGTATVIIGLQPVAIGTISDWAKTWNIYQGNSTASEKKPAIEELNLDGNVCAITFTLPDNSFDGVYANMFISAMNSTQDAYLAFDYANATPASKAYLFGSGNKALTSGTYNLDVKMMKANNITSASMAGSCIKGGTLTVAEDGKATITIDLQPVTVGTISDWAEQWKIYNGNSPSGETTDAAAHINSDGKVDQISFELKDNSVDGVYVNMFVSAMNTAQDAYLAFDYSGCGESTTNTYTGTAHVDQFGEYDVNVTVTVTDGVITGITVEGTNFGGTHADYNKSKLQAAIDGLKEAFNGKSADDAEGIDGVEAVTGATYSSNAIKSAILNALSLAVEDEVINIPTEKLAQGEYTVDIAFYTDNVKHSLIENDKAKATIKVDADGKLTLTTDVINGTVKEPLYVLNFNGYYENNDISKALKTDADVTMGTVDYSDDVFEKDTPVVTKVTFPLEGEYAKIYNTNASIYVPAMKNLTGNITGIEFDRGIFKSDCFAKIYWDSIEKISEPVVMEDGSYTADISILKIDSDDTSSASRSFATTDVPIRVEDGKAYVRLSYTSPMIEKIEQLKDGSYVELTKTAVDGGNYVEAELNSVDDIATIQFTINTGTSYGTMVNQARVKINTDTLKEAAVTPSYEYGSAKTVLKPGTYNVPAKLMNSSNIATPSMAGSCVKGAEVTVNEDGSALVKVDLQAVTVGTISDWAEKWNVYQENAASGNVKPAVEGINSDGKVESIMFILPDNSFDGVYVNMFVPAMNYSPDAYLAIDFANAKVKEEETTTENSTETTTETTTEYSTETTTESTTESTTEVPVKAVKYSVPVKMVQAANPSLESMGNGAIDGNAIVTVMNGKSTVELSFKAYTLSGLYGHLLKLWSYPTADAMNYSWWNDAEYEVPAGVIETYIDYGLNYTQGDTTQSEFVKTFKITRTAEKENSIYIRISVDAMAGFDQAARLDLDWDNAQVITEVEVSTESTTEAVTEGSTESTTEAAEESTTASGGGNNSDDESNEIEDGKYWMEIALWNANIDQASMGDSVFENNRKALVSISGNTATIEIGTNPVAVSGYTSALQDIRSDNVNINVDSRESFTTNTRFDGQEHTFDYIAKFSFDVDDITTEYIPVEISVPYTPMDGISANVGGYIAARLKLDWSGLVKADDNETLNPDSSSAAGTSSSGGGGSSVNTSNKDTGIKIEAEEFVFPDNTTFTTKAVTTGTEYATAKKLVGDNFRLFSISAENDGEAVTPSGVANIYFPVEKEDGNNIAIYRIVEGDKNTEAGKTELEYRLSDDGKYYVVTVKEFGLFAVANTDYNDVEAVSTMKPVTENTGSKEIAFKDIDNHWAEDYILKAVDKGLFTGVESDKFAPDMDTTRAMFVIVLGRLNGVSENKEGNITFKDVNKEDYFYPFVVWASENDIVEGFSEDRFAPELNITREQMARIMYEFAKNNGIELKKVARTEFTDADNISSWAEESVNALSEAGIINGRTDGTFDPKGNATRAEIATMLINFIDEYMA